MKTNPQGLQMVYIMSPGSIFTKVYELVAFKNIYIVSVTFNVYCFVPELESLTEKKKRKKEKKKDKGNWKVENKIGR